MYVKIALRALYVVTKTTIWRLFRDSCEGQVQADGNYIYKKNNFGGRDCGLSAGFGAGAVCAGRRHDQNHGERPIGRGSS